MKKTILILVLLFTVTNITAQGIILGVDKLATQGEQGIQGADGADGTSNANVYPILLLSDITGDQSVNSDKIWEIQGDIDLVDSDIILPSNVYIKDGGGSIVTSGTATLKTVGNSVIDTSILNYQLNWDATSEGNLKNSIFYFDKTNWNIDENITSPSFTNTTGRDIAIQNMDNFQKAIDDSKLFGASKITLHNIDFYIGNAYYDEPHEDTVGDLDLERYTIKVPSFFTIEMDGSVHIRSYPNRNRSTRMFTLRDVDNISIIGGNLHGERDTHYYDNQLRITSGADSGQTEVLVNLGHPNRTPVLVEHTVPLTGITTLEVAQSMASYFDGLAGYSASYESPAWTSQYVVTISNDTPGLYELASISGNDTSGVAASNGTGTHENSHAIAIQGGRDITIKSVVIDNTAGDGISIVGSTSGQPMTYENNSQRVNISNCTITNARRLAIAPNSVNGLVVINNTILNAGQTVGNNLGTSPSSGIHLEPYRSRDGAGVLTEQSRATNVLIQQNTVIDSYTNSISSFTSTNVKIIGNTVNNPIAILHGYNNYAAGNTIDNTLGDFAGTLGFYIDIYTDTYPVIVERGTNHVVTGNFVIGRNDPLTTEVGLHIAGAWKFNFNNNIIRNIGGKAITITGVTQQSKIHNNIIEAEETLTTSEGVDFVNTDTDQLIVSDNYVKVYNLALDNDGSNFGTITTNYNLDNRSLVFDNNYFENWNGKNDARQSSYTTYKNNHFMQELSVTGAGNEYNTFDDNVFEDGLVISGTLTTLSHSIIKRNTFNTVNTSSGLSFESRGASMGNLIIDNDFNQTSGNEAMRIFEGSGGTHTDYVVSGNKLLRGGATEFMDLEVDDSSIRNNIDESTGATSQTITLGTGAVANRIN